jgi:hypothetical protein
MNGTERASSDQLSLILFSRYVEDELWRGNWT